MLDHPPASTSRRRFLGALGATAALPLVGAVPVWAEPQMPAHPPAAEPEPPRPPEDPEAAGDAADAESLLEILQRRYGTRFDAAQRDAIHDDLQSSLRAGRALRAVPLRNSDEPDIVFRALVRET